MPTANELRKLLGPAAQKANARTVRLGYWELLERIGKALCDPDVIELTLRKNQDGELVYFGKAKS